jgi:flagellar biosynthesis anti-sigma factor FlgM
MSEVDMERVRQVQEQILQGTYNPDARAVAEAMLQELGG